jgi:hypothetical protein
LVVSVLDRDVPALGLILRQVAQASLSQVGRHL